MAENSNVSSAKSLTEDFKPSGWSLMYIIRRNDPNIEPCGTPASTDDQFEHWSLSTSS